MQENLELEQLPIPAKDKIIPLIMLLVGTSAIAVTGLFIRVSVHEMSVNATMFNRLWIGCLAFTSLNILQEFRSQTSDQDLIQASEPEPSYQLTDIVLLVVVAIIYFAGRFLWTFSLSETTMANAMILNGLIPFFTTVGGWLFFKQRFSIKFLIGLAVAILGSVTLGIDDLQKVNVGLITGDAVVPLSSLLFAAYLLILEKIRAKFSPLKILLWRCLIGTALMVPIVLWFEGDIFPTSQLGWMAVISMVMIGEVLGHGLVVYSIKYVPASFVAITTLLEPLIVIILAWIFFAERLDNLTWVALALMLLGMFLASDTSNPAPEELPSANE